MNPESIELYAEQGVSLREPLEVAVCAQHCNGGLRGSIWWESSIKHLFPIGEVCGTHGVRPGGSALNAGQVGGLRAAQYIANVYTAAPMAPARFVELVRPQVQHELGNLRRLESPRSGAIPFDQVRQEIQERMSAEAAFIRSAATIGDATNAALRLQSSIRERGMAIRSRGDLLQAIQNEHLCVTHVAVLQTIKALIDRGGGSRGAYVVLDPSGDLTMDTRRGSELRHRSENLGMRSETLETRVSDDGRIEVYPVAVRPLPRDDAWYETTWRDWVEGRVFE
jgi:succinate dehydrogenase/fumarate reductase flavoprotein subunit